MSKKLLVVHTVPFTLAYSYYVIRSIALIVIMTMEFVFTFFMEMPLSIHISAHIIIITIPWPERLNLQNGMHSESV